MSAIDTYLQAIQTAVYGEEVRGAIHDAIQQCYTDVSEGGAAFDSIAEPFNQSLHYNVGDYVTYNQILYRFTSEHTASMPWNSSEVAQVVLGDEIENVKSAMVSVNGTTLVIDGNV